MKSQAVEVPAGLDRGRFDLVPNAGCGGATSPEGEVQAVAIDFVQAIVDDKRQEPCGMTTDPPSCLESLVLAQSSLGERGWKGALPSDWRERLEELPVTFEDESHATMPGLAPGEEPRHLVKEDGDGALSSTTLRSAPNEGITGTRAEGWRPARYGQLPDENW